ncbi:ECF RNA polymerase sigma factor SigW [Planctomycetes bacterium Poly30]|uniref:RNA polymerase sigma factor n=1 Tax=Saltatorellus ferox TaxID=2528018 RepID=A0A518EYP3_9BACT|nr:ECF RNA polymerase sigma factor SigW [Planctomycetes bacterium Poly30]
MKDRATRLFLRYVRRADGRAIGRLFDLVGPELLALARHLAPDIASAEDLVQATFLVALEGADRFDRSREVRPWLFGILTREAARGRRDAGRRRARESSLRVEDAAVVSVIEEVSDVAEAVEFALQRLPERYRAVLQPFLMSGLTAPEIALQLPEAPSSGTVRVQIARGLERLRKLLPSDMALAVAAGSALPRGHAAVREVVVAAARPRTVLAGSSPMVSSAVVHAPLGLAFGGLVMSKLLLAVGGLVGAALFAVFLIPSRSQDVVGAPLQANPIADARRVALRELAPRPESRSRPGPSAGAESELDTVDGAPVSTSMAPEMTAYWTGRVLMADGSAAAKAVIHDAIELTPVALSDDEGLFRLPVDGKPPFVFAILPGQAHSLVALTDPLQPIELRLGGPGASLEVRLVDEGGEPVPEADVLVCEPSALRSEPLWDPLSGKAFSVHPRLRARTDVEGWVKLSELPCITHHVHASASGFVERWIPTPPLVPGERITFDVVMGKDASLGGEVSVPDSLPESSLRIEGRLVDSEGAPLASWYVRSHERSLMVSESQGRTGVDGAFVLEGVSARTQVLSAMPYQGYYDPEKGFAVFRDVHAGDAALVLEVSGKCLTSRLAVVGRVAYPDGSVPALAKVGIRSREEGWSTWALADADGRFHAGTDALGGDYELQVLADTERGLHPTTSKVSLGDGEQLDVGVIEVPRPGWLEVSLLAPDEPRRGSGSLTLAATDGSGSEDRQEEIPWDAAMPLALVPGLYRVGFNATHYSSRAIEVMVMSERTTRLTLSAESTTRVRLSVVDADEREPEGVVQLEIRHAPTGVLLREEMLIDAMAIEIDLEPLEGDYRVMARAQDGSVGSIEGPLVGRERSHTIRLLPR